MPVLNDYLISHQWARELKRSGVRNYIAVYFKLDSDEKIWFVSTLKNIKKCPLNSAIKLFLDLEDKLGYRIFIERKIEVKEITKIRHIPKPMGWRYEPHAQGKEPCPCPVCIQRGGFKTNKLREETLILYLD